jgi:hypothetical protein
MAEEDTGNARATSGWDAILGEPIVSIRDEGWLALRRVDQISPRPQTPPVTVSPSLRWLVLELPPQDEEAAPGPSLPPSLAEQLSLTLAARRQRARRRSAPVEDEPIADVWPETSASELQEMETAPVPSWRQPLRLLGRLLSRTSKTETRLASEAPTPDRAPEHRHGADAAPPGTPPPTATETAPPKSEDPPAPGEHEGAPSPRTTSLGDETSLPIVLAKGPSSTLAVPAGSPAPGQPLRRGESLPRRAVAAHDAGVAHEPRGLQSVTTADEGRQASQVRPSAFSALVSRLTQRTPPAPAPPAANAADSSTPETFAELPPEQRAAEVAAAEAPTLVHRSAAGDQARAARDDDPGEPLSPVLRERMEGLVDMPLSEVRIFRGGVARRVTERLSADAVSAGPNVYFAPGEGNPATTSGRALLAHELSHVAAHSEGEAGLSPWQEERSALRLEHAVQRQEGLGLTEPLHHAAAPGAAPQSPMAPQPLAFQGPRLQGRSVRAGPAAPSSTAGLFGVASAAPGGGEGGAPSVARAGRERTAASMEPPADEEPADEAGSSGSQAGGLSQEEQAGLVERAVDAVMRRLRRETELERERRGAFRSEIGG